MALRRTNGTTRCRVVALGWCILALLLSTSGCGGPRIPPEELGEVLTELPKLPEAEKPYERPELVADGLEVPAAEAQALPAEGEPPSDVPEAAFETDATTGDSPPPGVPETTSPDDPK